MREEDEVEEEEDEDSSGARAPDEDGVEAIEAGTKSERGGY
jgi:hypothetical protein